MKKYILALPVMWAIMSPLCTYAGGPKKNQPEEDKSEMREKQMYQQEMNEITPYAPPKITRGADPFITADFIWWKAQEDGLAYAFNGNSIADSTAFGAALPFPAEQAHKGSVKYPKFKYKPGFKVGFGLKFRHDGWDLFTQYTWWRNSKHNSKRSSVQRSVDNNSFVMTDTLIPSSLAALSDPTDLGEPASGLTSFDTQSSNGAWRLKFNAVDFELGRDFWISKFLTLRPFVGLKFSWMHQKFNVNYVGVLGLPAVNTSSFSSKINQWAAGLRGGLNTAWYMSKKWSIFGDFALSGLCNHFGTSRKDFVTTATIVNQNTTNLKNSLNSTTAVLEWALGLRFETLFCNDDFMFMLEAGWEQQIWFNQNQFIFMPNAVPADLSFQGATVKVGFYF